MIVIYARARVVVRHKEMHRWTLSPRGRVARVVGAAVREAKALAVAATPKRSGELARSYSVKAVSFGPAESIHRLINTAGHARYVMKGTAGPIHARGRKKMPVGRSQLRGGTVPRGGKVVFKRSVRGQEAQGEELMVKPIRIALARRGIV